MTSERRRLRLPAVASLVACLAVSTGCVSIPTDSPVSRGRDLGVPDEPQLNSNLPPGPAPGATREEIAAGFFEAMLAYPRSESLARSFLTPDAAARWNPAETLVVYDDQDLTEEDGVAVFRSRRLGSLDERGSWTSSTPGTSEVTVPMRTEQVDGELRLASPPTGTYIDADYFDRYFDPFALHFFDPTGTILTPDPVYLLLGESTATNLVRDLLKGPSRQLRGVAYSVAPENLVVSAPVRVSAAGLAEVPLSGSALTMSPDDRRLFAAQLTWTLRALPEIETIAITVDGQPFSVEGSGTEFGVDEFAGYDPAGFAATRQLFGLTPRGLGIVSQDSTTRVLGSVNAAARDARSVAADPSGALAAVVSQEGGNVSVGAVSTVGGGTSPWFRRGEDLLRPSWDIHRALWLVDRTADGARVYVATRDRARSVSAPGITAEQVLSFAISRDGTRMAAVVREGGKVRLVIALIDRSAADPVDVTLTPATTVFGPDVTFSGANNLAWLSPTSVAVLANEDGGDLQPFEVSIDGSRVITFDGFLPIRPVSVASGPNSDIPLVVGSRRGELYVSDPESGWASFGAETPVLSPVYPG